MKVCIFLLLLICSHHCFANDACTSAVSLTPTPTICGGSTTTILFGPITPTGTPPNTCELAATPDFWLHLNVPISFTGSYMIRRRAGTTIQAQAEVLYNSGCLPPNACCEVGMIPIGCFNFEEFPNAIILQNPTPGDYYIRVWDALLATSGTFVTSVHPLSADINDWIICDDVSGEGTGFKANQLIIQPGNMFDISIFNPMFKVVDSCLCADPPLLLFQASDFEIFTDGKITAQNAPGVEGTGYNYKMEFRRLPVAQACGGGVICVPINKYVPVKTTSISRLAIIDSGVNSGHEAFEFTHWSNDDPENPDDCVQVDSIGYDFKFEQMIPEDSLGHGSWVAGTVTEDFPSDIQLQLMSLKFFGGNDDFLFDAVCAIHYAVDQGASTIVTSWGFRSAEYPEILSGALLASSEQDVLMIASAGNLGFDNDDSIIGKYPANAPLVNVISVTAFDETIQAVPDYANFGATTVDLAAIDHVIAPGSVIAGTSLNTRDSVVGTSISAPRVARTAAIIKAYYPILNAQDIRQCILTSVKKIPALMGVVATGGTLDHDAALTCSASRAAAKACLTKSITVSGTLLNDVAYKTSTFIRALAIIEPFAKVLMEAGNYISFQSGFEVKIGAELEANNQNCETVSESVNKNE